MLGEESRPNAWRTQVQRYPRLPLRVPVMSEPLDETGVPLQGESQNLSQGGILLRLPRGVTPRAPVRVTLQLQARGPLVLTGRVVWIRPHPDLPGWAVGVEFAEELSDHVFLAIIDEEDPPWERLPWIEEPRRTD
jgi:hypothetical protein